jgi:hypothetical protein
MVGTLSTAWVGHLPLFVLIYIGGVFADSISIIFASGGSLTTSSN